MQRKYTLHLNKLPLDRIPLLQLLSLRQNVLLNLLTHVEYRAVPISAQDLLMQRALATLALSPELVELDL